MDQEEEKNENEYENASTRIRKLPNNDNIDEDVNEQTVRVKDIETELTTHKNGSLKGAYYISNALTCKLFLTP